MTKAYMAEMSCSQLLLIEFATYMLKINLLVINYVRRGREMQRLCPNSISYRQNSTVGCYPTKI